MNTNQEAPSANINIKTSSTTENKEPKDKQDTQNSSCSDKKICKLWNFCKSKLFYFLMASGTVVSSYLIWKKYYKKH